MTLERQMARVDVGARWSSVVTMALLAVVGVGALAQGTTPAPAAATTAPAAPQQNVPDAPKPQILPKFNTITPLAPALPDAPPAPAPDAAAVPSSLPSAPTAQARDEEPLPEGMNPGEGVSTATRLSVNVQFVQVPFTVKDSKGKLVPALTARDVRVYENGLRQQMKLFTVDPFPLSVSLVIDQSVTQDTMEKINNSLHALQGAFTPYDEVAVFTYNNGVTKQTGFTAAQSARLGVILERSKGSGREPLMGMGGPLSQGLIKNNQAVDPNTNGAGHVNGGIMLNPPREYHALLDAILSAAQETSHAARGRRRIVYVISDGKEYGSKAREKEVIKYCQTNHVEVYATLVGDSAVPGLGFLDRIHLPLTMRDDILPRMTFVTGGQTDPEFRQGGIEKSFAKITEEVRTQYTVGYYTHESPFNEKFRKYEVRVLRPNLTIIAPDGYYPSASDSRPVPVTPSATP